jgi:hypothetical protein
VAGSFFVDDGDNSQGTRRSGIVRTFTGMNRGVIGNEGGISDLVRILEG